MKLFIYDMETKEIVATSKGKTKEDCECKATSYLGWPAEYACTYTPAFGTVGGLIDQPEINEL